MIKIFNYSSFASWLTMILLLSFFLLEDVTSFAPSSSNALNLHFPPSSSSSYRGLATTQINTNDLSSSRLLNPYANLTPQAKIEGNSKHQPISRNFSRIKKDLSLSKLYGNLHSNRDGEKKRSLASPKQQQKDFVEGEENHELVVDGVSEVKRSSVVSNCKTNEKEVSPGSTSNPKTSSSAPLKPAISPVPNPFLNALGEANNFGNFINQQVSTLSDSLTKNLSDYIPEACDSHMDCDSGTICCDFIMFKVCCNEGYHEKDSFYQPRMIPVRVRAENQDDLPTFDKEN